MSLTYLAKLMEMRYSALDTITSQLASFHSAGLPEAASTFFPNITLFRICSFSLSSNVARGQSSPQKLWAASEAELFYVCVTSEERMRKRRRRSSGGLTLGVMALFLTIVFFFSGHYCCTVCVFACMCWTFFFLHCYAMQYLTLGRTCARGDGGRAGMVGVVGTEWMYDHFNLCVILDCTTSS